MTSIPGNDQGFVEALSSAALPADDLVEQGRCFFRFEQEGKPVGYGGYELHDQDVLIRSLVVIHGHRGGGLGKMVAEALLLQARLSGATTAYLLTTSASAFFRRLGFSEIDRSAAPTTILQTRQAASLCPSTAALMMLELQE
ncbi:GNAT family N-acetyltransferase [Rhizobium sp. KVB221]|uniref:GNAT family N-acetyltransferase n=2 Tax=Rhizobium setariae TaxID=2801340 RepID=A0A936YTU7_9HYPH|nr:arsenic resistance N-acetyltransferase ArsN2 [Rhizobium setariae]MBL0372375.1 GNAT family N-acetyltransferase [Rhizobium setariae]